MEGAGSSFGVGAGKITRRVTNASIAHDKAQDCVKLGQSDVAGCLDPVAILGACDICRQEQRFLSQRCGDRVEMRSASSHQRHAHALGDQNSRKCRGNAAIRICDKRQIWWSVMARCVATGRGRTRPLRRYPPQGADAARPQPTIPADRGFARHIRPISRHPRSMPRLRRGPPVP